MTVRVAATSVLVTGASSGLGTALALACARPGLHLALTGRDQQRLDAVALRCRERGAEVACAALDLCDAGPVAEWLAGVDAAHPLDLVLLNAGIAGGPPEPGRLEPAEVARRVFATNLGGVLNALHPLLPALVARRSGRIVVVSSLAALAPLPDYPAYSGSKAALLAYGAALRADLRRHGVSVSVACPGFVATPMGEAYRGARPLEISAEAAARRILAGAMRNQAVIAFPAALALAARIGALVPEGLRGWAMAALNRSGDAAPRTPAARGPTSP